MSTTSSHYVDMSRDRSKRSSGKRKPVYRVSAPKTNGDDPQPTLKPSAKSGPAPSESQKKTRNGRSGLLDNNIYDQPSIDLPSGEAGDKRPAACQAAGGPPAERSDTKQSLTDLTEKAQQWFQSIKNEPWFWPAVIGGGILILIRGK